MKNEGKSKAIKKLQVLYAWAEFYNTNKLFDSYSETQRQIETHKADYELY